jgi:hypothetical protein
MAAEFISRKTPSRCIFFFDRAMMGPMAKNARATGADGHSPNADGTRRKDQRSIFKNVPADRHHGCQ